MASARRPGEEAATHVSRMTESLRRMVAAARVGTADEEANSAPHAIALHAANLGIAADALLALIHELRTHGARNDLRAVDAEIGAALAAGDEARAARAAARARARDARDRDAAPAVPLDGDDAAPPFHVRNLPLDPDAPVDEPPPR